MWTTTILRAPPRSSILSSAAAATLSQPIRRLSRGVATLSTNPHIYIHPHPTIAKTHILSLLPTSPPTPRLSLGTTTTLPPTPSSVTETPSFLPILHSVLSTHASSDPDVRAQAMALATPNIPRVFSAQEKRRRERRGGDQEGASGQGGAGGAGSGGWVHVSDTRKAVDFGRIAEPEDIFGSLEVARDGTFVKGEEGEGEGRFQWGGTYRLVTNEGILGLSDFLRGKLIERLKAEEAKEKAS